MFLVQCNNNNTAARKMQTKSAFVFEVSMEPRWNRIGAAGKNEANKSDRSAHRGKTIAR